MTYNSTLNCMLDPGIALPVCDQQLIQSCIRFQYCHTEYTEWVRLHIVDTVGDQLMCSYANDLEVSWERTLQCIESLVSQTRLGASYKLDAARMYATWASPGDGRASTLLAQAYAELHVFSSTPEAGCRIVSKPSTNSNGVAFRAD